MFMSGSAAQAYPELPRPSLQDYIERVHACGFVIVVVGQPVTETLYGLQPDEEAPAGRRRNIFFPSPPDRKTLPLLFQIKLTKPAKPRYLKREKVFPYNREKKIDTDSDSDADMQQDNFSCRRHTAQIIIIMSTDGTHHDPSNNNTC
jgi:hypothetical protein